MKALLNRGTSALAIILLPILFFSCSSNTNHDPSLYLEYAGDAKNGLIQSISYNDIDISLKLIPSNYFLLKDNALDILNKTMIYDLKEDYAHSLYFMLDVSPKRKSNKIIDRNTFDIEEFKRKTQGLNFNLEQLVSININGNYLYPVLSSLQNVYELDGSKSILLAFQLEQILDTDIKCSFDDKLFTGETFEFTFLKADFDNIPQLSI